MKRPAFQFYPGDWLQDAGLRMCSAGARGLWIDMICLMHQGTPYGYLKVNLAPILPANLARISGSTLPDVEGWLTELEEAGVFSRDEAKAIYSRRMIRDENLRAARAAGGILGGNPALTGKKKPVPKVNHAANLEPTPSSSSSSSPSSTSKSKEQNQEHVQPAVARASKRPAGTHVHFEGFWQIYPVKKGKAAALKTWVTKNLDEIAAGIVMDVRARLAQDRQWQDRQYIPHGSTYLNQRGWEDAIEPITGGNHATSAPSRKLSLADQAAKLMLQRREDRRAAEAEATIVGHGPGRALAHDG